VYGHHRLERFVEVDSDSIASFDSDRSENVGQLPDPLIKRLPTEFVVTTNHRCGIREPRRGVSDK
jgi:hypothetical protein